MDPQILESLYFNIHGSTDPQIFISWHHESSDLSISTSSDPQILGSSYLYIQGFNLWSLDLSILFHRFFPLIYLSVSIVCLFLILVQYWPWTILFIFNVYLTNIIKMQYFFILSRYLLYIYSLASNTYLLNILCNNPKVSYPYIILLLRYCDKSILTVCKPVLGKTP